jgi:hypothetical protein
MTLNEAEKSLTYDLTSHPGNGSNDEIVTREYGGGDYDPDEDGYPVVHMVNGVDEDGHLAYHEHSNVYASAKTWEEARELVGADVKEEDAPTHGKLHGGGPRNVGFWVVERTEEA